MSASGELLLGSYQTKDAYMKQLQELRQTKKTLEKAGYVMQALADDNLAQKRKCSRCHKCEYNIPSPSWVASVLNNLCSHLQKDLQALQ